MSAVDDFRRFAKGAYIKHPEKGPRFAGASADDLTMETIHGRV